VLGAVRDFFRENARTPQVSRRDPFDIWESDGVTILCGDFFALTPSWLADIGGVYDRASLIAMPPAMRPRYAQQLAAILPAAAPVLLVTLEYPPAAMQGPPFTVDEAEVRQLYESRFRVRSLLRKDVLAENPRFRERGLTALHEHVYRLDPVRS
jgi:thiopurine S-methyltransferase